LFVAIFLPDHLLSHLAAFPQHVRSPRLRWMPVASLHVTLRFLGEMPPASVAGLEGALARAASGSTPFRLAVAGGGVFPNDRRPTAFWARLAGDVKRLGALAERVNAGLVDAGVPLEERPFTPHLTLARCRTGVRCLPEDAHLFADAADEIDAAPFEVNEFHLVRSHTEPTGPRYESLRAFPLAA
jgi:RNA 2',3'-cyclic 3'-phosphodiesterase